MGSISFEALSTKALNNVHHLSYLEKTALKAISEEVDLPSGVQTSDLMHLANYLNEVFMANIQEGDKKSENDLVELINFLLFATDWKKGSSDQSDGMSTGQKVACACDCGCNLLLNSDSFQNNNNYLNFSGNKLIIMATAKSKHFKHFVEAMLAISAMVAMLR